MKNFLKDFLISALLGASSFILVLGLPALNPRNISWLEEGDMLMHYLGWSLYRKSPISNPIGYNEGWGANIASSIVYSDSIPLIAIPLKFLDQYLSNDFQFFGIWLLACFVLFAYFSCLIIKNITSDRVVQALLILILLFSPPLLFRTGWHMALVAQFFILSAIYLNLNRSTSRESLKWALILSACLLVQFYIFSSVYLLWVASIFSRVSSGIRSIKSSLLSFTCINLLLLLLAWQAGYFSVELSAAGTSHYGGYAINVLSIFNPHGWSYLLPDIYDHHEQFEDLAYIGLGNIFLVLIAILNYKQAIVIAFKFSKLHSFLLFAILCLTLFAVSNHIAIGGIRFIIPLPDLMISIFGVLRSSGRMFWPAFYLLVIFLMYVAIKTVPQHLIRYVFLIACLLQIIDTSKGWLAIKTKIAVLSTKPSVIQINNRRLNDPIWENIPKYYGNVLLVPLQENQPQYFDDSENINWPLFSSYAYQHNLMTNSVYSCRTNFTKIRTSNVLYEKMIHNGSYPDDSVYIVSNEKIIPILSSLDTRRDILVRIDDVNLLIPNFTKCVNCFANSRAEVIRINFSKTNLNEPIEFGRGKKGFNFLLDLDKYQQVGYGWSYPEIWGVWSEGKKAKIILPLPENGAELLKIKFRALVSQSDPSQIIEIWVNNKFQTSHKFTGDQEASIDLDLKDELRNYVAIEFRTPNAKSPKNIGVGSDERVLGVGLVQAVFM